MLRLRSLPLLAALAALAALAGSMVSCGWGSPASREAARAPERPTSGNVER